MAMEQFERWYLPDKDIYTNEYEMQKMVWKAACEYWLGIAKEHDQEMQFMIEDELGDD